MIKVCHMTSAHGAEDVRIFHKECVSLAKVGYDVYLVERGESYEKNGVHIVGVGEIPAGRIKRMTKGAKTVYQKALEIDADIYHFHDPELLPYGLKLKSKGKKVIFDSHEDVPAQIMDKVWIPVPFRRLVSGLYARYELYAVRRLDAVSAVRKVAYRFQNKVNHMEIIENYPRLDDIQFHDTRFSQREPIICYAGGISKARGEDVMIEAMRDLDSVLIIAGRHAQEEIDGGKIHYTGYLNRDEINALYGVSVVGLCLLRPIIN